MRVWNHKKTIHFSWQQGPQSGNWTICFSRKCDTNAHIKFIFNTAIYDPEWMMNLIDLGENRKTKLFGVAILWKYADKACARHKIIRNAPTNFILYVAIDIQGWKVPIQFSKARASILWKEIRCVLIWNVEKSDRKWFSTIQNGRQQPFCEKILLHVTKKSIKNYEYIWKKIKVALKWLEMR